MQSQPCNAKRLELYKFSAYKKHPRASQLEKLGYREPEEWGYWRNFRGVVKTYAQSKAGRLNIARHQAPDWPLPLPNEPFNSFADRHMQHFQIFYRDQLRVLWNWREKSEDRF